MDLLGSFATVLATVLLSIPAASPRQENNETKTLEIAEEFNVTREDLVLSFEIKAAEYVFPLVTREPPSKNFLGAPDYVVAIAQEASARTGMPLRLMLAQLRSESGFNPRAVSRTNDHGIAQIHFPKPGVTLDQAYDPNFAINWQADNMARKYGLYGNWRDTLAAYNAGDAGRSRGLGFGYADKVLRLAGY